MQKNLDFIQIQKALEAIADIEYRLVPIERLESLKLDLERFQFSGVAGQFIQENYMNYCFDIPKNYQSILVVSYPQPHAQIGIELEGGIQYVTIPSGYYNGNLAVYKQQEIINALETNGIQAKYVYLPLKLLGARSGLTQYGKNNISYVKTYGSQHRLIAFFTDIKCDSDVWVDDIQMKLCQHCNACVDACPYGAIQKDTVLIDPNKCLSFYLDLMNPLPSRFSDVEIEGIIGCTHCQDCCSLNHHFSSNHHFSLNCKETLAVISKAQVEEIRAIDDYERLSDLTKELVDTLGFKDGYDLFKRNFGLLALKHNEY